ncbi:type II secretion system F family protein [bacterium]|nr:type II secretion system F family protein [bacterium]
MPSFEFRAVSPTGQIVTEVLEAANEQVVSKEILRKGYRPISIKKRREAKGGGELSLFKPKIKTEEIVLFTKEMVTLLRAGVPMLTSLEALSSQSTKAFGGILNKIYIDVMSGKSLSQALDQHPKIFSKLYVNSIHAGEMSGALDEVLERMAGVLQHDEETRKKVKSAMRYPILVILAMVAAFIVVMTMVIPKFALIFGGLNVELPIFTQILLGLSEFIKQYILVIVGVFAVVIIGFQIYIKNSKGRVVWDGFKMKIPLIGNLVVKSSLARFTKMFETLNRSGLPIIQTLNTVAAAVGNMAIEKTIRQVATGVEGGQGIAGTMKKYTIFPPMVVRMISIGEQSGSLDDMLGSISNHFDMEVEYAIKGLTSMIEPMLTVVLGGAVTVMALGIFLPMWNLASAIQ